MKRSVVLVLNADADPARAVASAAATRNCDLRFVQTSKEFFHFCSEDFENVTAIVLDVDPGTHGMAILEASEACENTPPIIVVSALEEHRLGPVVQRHGAIACLGKPLSFLRLSRALIGAQCMTWRSSTNRFAQRPSDKCGSLSAPQNSAASNLKQQCD